MLKIYDATLSIYERLCVKDCAYGGWTEDEFKQTLELFMSLSNQAQHLLNDFYEHLSGKRAEDIDVLIDFAREKGIIWYPSDWKTMYHGLKRRIEDNCMVPKDKQNIHSPRGLFPYLNQHLSAWYLVEKETGKPCEFNTELFRKMRNYLYFSGYSPMTNKYPGISFFEQAVIADEVYHYIYENWDDDYEDESVPFYHQFKPRMEALMKKRGLPSFLTPTLEQMNRVEKRYRLVPKFMNEIEREVFTAFQENRAIKFLYFTFENGHPITSHVYTTPVRFREGIPGWILFGKDEKSEIKEYNVQFILQIEDENRR
ncbi:MAG: hypothetical protein IKH26_10795 [Bacteroidaceae bacterium]|nr:hypothetical protein [Bacteroidaceae bacterium]